MSDSVLDIIKQQIENNRVLLYMKGTPDFPQCGFSGKAASVLKQLKVSFNYVNILEYPQIRAALPQYAQWATFPQLWVDGELIGGSDIMADMYQSGDLQELISAAELPCDGFIQDATKMEVSQ